MTSAAPEIPPRKSFVAPVVSEHPSMTELTQGIVLVSGNDIRD